MSDKTPSESREHPLVRATTHTLTPADRWVHVLARIGINRNGHRIEPGLYSLGAPTRDSAVFVTGNYALSFDALRRALTGMDAYLLVLDTKGINVWCAAGKGTFGTDELVHRIETVGLGNRVDHRTLIVPQLAAPGVAAHEVKRRAGFRVEYGPVLAKDLPEYLARGRASDAMRRVRFPLHERVKILPVEIWTILAACVILALPAYFAGGRLFSLAVLLSVFAGVLVFPVLLPWIPTPNFSTKGFLVGAAAALPVAVISLAGTVYGDLWARAGWTLASLLVMIPLSAFAALNLTGSTPFTSWSGVRREILAYFPLMAWMFVPGVVLSAAMGIARRIGGG